MHGVMRWESPKPEQTHALAHRLSPLLRKGDCLALEGTLGAGKTEFARALIRALSGDEALEVPSPTFTLAHSYPVTLQGEAAECWHVDLYRIQEAAELVELGLSEALEHGILLVEWPAVAGNMLPASLLLVRISALEGTARRIELLGDASWRLRLEALSATTTGE